METIHITGSNMEPTIYLDPEKGVLEFTGYSSPDDVTESYQPVFDWLEEYMQAPKDKTTLNINMKYYNTATSKMFLTIMEEVLELEEQEGKTVEMNWYYEELDEDMEEAVEDYEEILEHDINKISYNP